MNTPRVVSRAMHEVVFKGYNADGSNYNVRLLSSLRSAHTPEFQKRIASSAVGVTIGNFDGMHYGHQFLFRELQREVEEVAERTGAVPMSVLMTFAPHPRQVISRLRGQAGGRSKYTYLTSLRDKAALAAGYGFDVLFLCRFTPGFARMQPQEFISRYLVDALQARAVVVGYDWSFGKDRAGSVETLRQEGEARGIKALVMPPVELDGERVSSTLVRSALAKGDLERLEKLLGRRFSFSSLVRPGDRRGRELGFPTANLLPGGQLLPPDGIYAVRARVDGTTMDAVCNIGFRPTFAGTDRRVEVHVLEGLDHNFYGKRMEVEFVAWIRDDMKFSGSEELRQAIEEDVRAARRILDA